MNQTITRVEKDMDGNEVKIYFNGENVTLQELINALSEGEFRLGDKIEVEPNE